MTRPLRDLASDEEWRDAFGVGDSPTVSDWHKCGLTGACGPSCRVGDSPTVSEPRTRFVTALEAIRDTSTDPASRSLAASMLAMWPLIEAEAAQPIDVKPEALEQAREEGRQEERQRWEQTFRKHLSRLGGDQS